MTRGTAVVTKMTGNSNFQNPPVDLVGLKADIDVLSVLMAESLDGSKKVIAEKKKARSFGAGVDGQLERVPRCLACYSGSYCWSFSIDKRDKRGDVVVSEFQVGHFRAALDTGWVREKPEEIFLGKCSTRQVGYSGLQQDRFECLSRSPRIKGRCDNLSVDVTRDATLLDEIALSSRLQRKVLWQAAAGQEGSSV